MSDVSKPEKHEQEQMIFSCRHEAGLVSMRAWLIGQRESINARWPDADDYETPRLKGEAKLISKLIKLIELGPSVKTERKPT